LNTQKALITIPDFGGDGLSKSSP